MWVLDSDPRLASAFANLTILDRAPDRDELRTRMLAATAVVPRLRQKVVDGAPLSTPITNPAMIAVTNPAAAVDPLATPNASASGSATTPTVRPATTSARQVRDRPS